MPEQAEDHVERADRQTDHPGRAPPAPQALGHRERDRDADQGLGAGTRGIGGRAERTHHRDPPGEQLDRGECDEPGAGDESPFAAAEVAPGRRGLGSGEPAAQGQRDGQGQEPLDVVEPTEEQQAHHDDADEEKPQP